MVSKSVVLGVVAIATVLLLLTQGSVNINQGNGVLMGQPISLDDYVGYLRISNSIYVW
jgi:hypothetical protein